MFRVRNFVVMSRFSLNEADVCKMINFDGITALRYVAFVALKL